jgi:hypothetical protein
VLCKYLNFIFIFIFIFYFYLSCCMFFWLNALLFMLEVACYVNCMFGLDVLGLLLTVASLSSTQNQLGH